MALATSSTGIGAFLPEGYGPLVLDPLQQQSIAMQVSTVVPTSATTFHLPVVSSDASGAWTAEGADITESDPGLTEVTVTPSKVAVIATISNELANDSSPAAANVVGQSLVQALRNSIDGAYFGSTVTNGPSGLGSIAGATSIGTTGTAVSDLDLFAEAASKIQQDGAEPTAFCLNPADWLTVTQLKTADNYNTPLLGADAAVAGARSILGIPVFVSAKVDAGTAWALAQSRSFVVLREDVTVEADQSAAFKSDSTVIRCIARVGFAFPSATSIVKIAVA